MISLLKVLNKQREIIISQSIKDNIEFYNDILGDDFDTFFDELEEEERDACYPINLVG